MFRTLLPLKVQSKSGVKSVMRSKVQSLLTSSARVTNVAPTGCVYIYMQFLYCCVSSGLLYTAIEIGVQGYVFYTIIASYMPNRNADLNYVQSQLTRNKEVLQGYVSVYYVYCRSSCQKIL